MTAHLDVEQLADLSAGLLGGRARAQAQSHLETCEHCRNEAAELARVSRTLRGAAEKGGMPADFADRLDFALRSEQASTRASGNVTALPRPATRRWWADHRVLQAAAVAVLVVAGGAIAVPLLDRAGSGPITASESAGGYGREEGAAAPKADDGVESGDTAARSGGVLESGTNYSEQTLAADVTRLLSALEAGRSPQDLSAGVAAPPPAATRLADPQALAECLRQLLPGKEAAPLLVDVARFEGRQATVIVLPRPDEPERIDIWVVEPGCRNGNAQALHSESAPRP